MPEHKFFDLSSNISNQMIKIGMLLLIRKEYSDEVYMGTWAAASAFKVEHNLLHILILEHGALFLVQLSKLTKKKRASLLAFFLLYNFIYKIYMQFIHITGIICHNLTILIDFI